MPQGWRACVMHDVDGFLIADAVPEPIAGGHNKGIRVIQVSGCDLRLCSEAPRPFQVVIPQTPVLAVHA